MWESMGKPKLVWSLVHLHLANQVKVLPLGQLSRVPMDIEELQTYANFELIEIVDDTNPYLTLLGIN